MKKLALALSLLTTMNMFAKAAVYDCTCIDTGYECDGLDYLSLKVDAKKINANFMDADRDVTEKFQATIDTSYKPRKNLTFKRFKTDLKFEASKIYPSLLVENSILNGEKSGSIKISEFANDGSFNHEWIFECSLAKK